jgi:signal transduction histidine kinase
VRPTLEAAELPVLLLTAKAQESDLAHGFSLGASDYLLKPVSFVELDARLGHHARLLRAVRALSEELAERRRLQGELDQATQQLTQAEHMATLGMLMAGIAHDLRNPLNYVQGAAEQLRGALPMLGSEDAAVRASSVARVEKVVGWVEQGTASMDAISLAMRNQARSGDAELSEVNVREVVNEALLLCRSRTKLCEVEVDVQDATIRADATGLGQLVMNLVSNAADAITEARERNAEQTTTIRVSARVEGDVFRLAVEDSGPGIPEHVRARILEPFFTTKPRGQGTGLGLAIVQRVVKQHGGKLTIDRSDALGGARFLAEWVQA